MTLAEVAARFAGARRTKKGGYEAYCPAHNDQHKRSLSIGRGDDGRILVWCGAGCSFEAIITAVSLTARDLGPRRATSAREIVATYRYEDAEGRLLYEVVRFAPKGFAQRRPDPTAPGGWVWGLDGVPRVLYCLPEVMAAAKAGRVVFVVEGEKDVEALRALGLTATTNPGGAGKWRPEYSEALRGAHVVVLPDNDEPGRRHADCVARALSSVAASVRVLELPDLPAKGDVSDWLAAGGTRAKLEELARAAPTWAPAAAPGAAASPAPSPVLIRCDTIEPREVEWIRPQRWPRGKLSLVVGDPGLAKSALLLDAAARISRGAAWPEGGLAPRGRVILLTAEDGLDDTVVPRLQAMGADLTQIVVLRAVRTGDQERPFCLEADLPSLANAVDQVRPVAIIIDPLTAYLGRADSHVDAEIRGVLGPVASFAEETGVGIIAIGHLNKAIQMRALYRLGGSVAFVAAARSVFCVVADGDSTTRRLFAPLKMNLAPHPPALRYTITPTPTSIKLQWDPEPVAGVDVEAALRGPASAPREAPEVAEAVTFLADELSPGPKPVEEIRAASRAAGIAWATLRRAKDRLGVESTRLGYGAGGAWWWGLPAKMGTPGRGAGAPRPIDAHPTAIDAHHTRNVSTFGQVPAVSVDTARTSPKVLTSHESEHLWRQEPAQDGAPTGPVSAPAGGDRPPAADLGDQVLVLAERLGWAEIHLEGYRTVGGDEEDWRTFARGARGEKLARALDELRALARAVEPNPDEEARRAMAEGA